MRTWHKGVWAVAAVAGVFWSAVAHGQSRATTWAPGSEDEVLQASSVSPVAHWQGEVGPFVPEDEVKPPDPSYSVSKPEPKPFRPEPSPSDDAGFAYCGPGCDPGCDTGCDNVCESDCGGCCKPTCRWCRCGTLADPWTLPLPQALKCRDVVVGGWISAGAYGNQHGDPSNGPLGFRNLATGSADQLWVFAERKVNTEKSVFDWGFRTDYVFGHDAQDTQCFGDQGWDFGWNSSRDYGSAIPQAYAEFGWNDLTIKAGHFYTPIGYEVVPANGRFFYSTSYTMYYGEPFTHTGALATYQISEKLAGSLGWTDGWDGSFENRNGASTILGGLNWTPGERFNLAWYFNAGRFGDGRFGGNNGEVYMQSVVATLSLTERLKYVLQSDYGRNYGLAADDAHWYGINQYLLYDLSECLSVGSRFEWFRDDDGVRVTGDGLGRVISNPGSYYEVTFGLNYRPHANITLRPELRYDWFNGSVAQRHSRPFDRGTKDEQLSGGFDLILTF